ncbi:lipocalin family protein [Christiangramia sabulilitoris]|uniref:Lipocalin family protein n=1 Tax=Christiangramia sabulilitoris TaxID=2583991 RepID=A0A550I2Q8_9FLAO|nr:lipocalin family protein [Christiangramia sabulilitoris]TRO65270.1 lipocalin family protein [Christiangramia sabulilitoris]
MKKLLILLVSVCLFTACSDDDDSGAVEGNIVGTWLLVEANNVPGFEVDDCTGQSTLTFNADNSASSTFFSESDGICSSATENGVWTSSENSKYTLLVPGFDDPVTGTVTFSSNNRFTFVPDVFTASNFVFQRN